jgi:hypothetical protein
MTRIGFVAAIVISALTGSAERPARACSGIYPDRTIAAVKEDPAQAESLPLETRGTQSRQRKEARIDANASGAADIDKVQHSPDRSAQRDPHKRFRLVGPSSTRC